MAEAVDPNQPERPPDEPGELLPARTESTELDSRRGGELGPPLPPSQHAPRFRMLTGGLVGVAIGALAAQILGQAYVTAYNAMRHNRESLSQIADELIDKRELHGDEVVELLQTVRPRRPAIDLLDRDAWPKL